MKAHQKLSLILEIIFWVITIVIAFGILLPIFNNFNAFPFLWQNVLIIVVAINYTRYTFLWRHIIFAKSNIIRALILLATIPLVFFMIQNLNVFQSYLDDSGYETFMELLKNPLAAERKKGLLQYIRSEFVFFSVAAIAAGVIFPIRIIISIWRTRNNKGI